MTGHAYWIERAVGRLLPAAAAMLSAATAALAQYPTEPPPAMELRPLTFPPFQEFKLPNGLEVVLVENHRLPVVSISLNMQAGARFEPRGQEGLANVVAEVMTKGTTTRTAEEIAEQIERVGASLNANAGPDFFSVSTTVLTEDVGLAFTLISDVVLNATYPEDELEIARRRFLSQIRLNKTSPAALASQFFQAALYGDHPYGRYETEASIEAITPTSLRAWARERLRPSGALLVVAGNLTRADLDRMARQYLGAWRGAPPAVSAPKPPAPRATNILLVHRPGSEQSNIRAGNLALEPASSTYFPAVVANKILGGGTDARLFMILREQKSWTYGAYSGIARRKDVGYFQANTEVRNAVTDSALTEVLAQLRRIRSEAVADSELTAAKGYLVGSFPLSIETPQQIAGQVASTKLFGLSETYLRTYRQRLAQVTGPELQRAARQVIKTDSLAIIVVGDGKVIYDKLTAIAPVAIVDVEGKPLTPAQLSPPATAVTFDLSALRIGRDSLAVFAQGQEFGYMVVDVARDGGHVVYSEALAIPAAGIRGLTTVRLAQGSLAPVSVEKSGSQGGQRVEARLTYSGRTVTGTAQEPAQGGPREIRVDTTLAEGTVDQETMHLITTVLPLEGGASFTINAFDPGSGVQTLTISVKAAAEVTVPAGTFSAFPVQIQAGAQGFVYYVTAEKPRRVVKIELSGQPVTFELVAN